MWDAVACVGASPPTEGDQFLKLKDCKEEGTSEGTRERSQLTFVASIKSRWPNILPSIW